MQSAKSPKVILLSSISLNLLYFFSLFYVWQKYFIIRPGMKTVSLIPTYVVVAVLSLFAAILILAIAQLVNLIFKKARNELLPDKFLYSLFLNLFSVFLSLTLILISFFL